MSIIRHVFDIKAIILNEININYTLDEKPQLFYSLINSFNYLNNIFI